MSLSTPTRLNNARSRRRSAFSTVRASGGGEDVFDGDHVTSPRLGLRAECAPALRGEPVILGAAVVVARAPLAVDPFLELEALQGGVQRALVHVEHTPGHLLNALADPPAVHRLERQRFEHQQIERTAKHVGWREVFHRMFLSDSYMTVVVLL